MKFDALKEALDQQAWLLAEPLLKKDAQQREIQAVDQEFEGCYSCDEVRTDLVLAE